MEITKEAVRELQHGHATAGTIRSRLTELDFTVYKGVLVRCPGGSDPTPNTDPIWIGGAGVTADSGATGGIPILPGDAIFIPIDKPNFLWVVSTAADQDIAWMGI